MSGNSGEFDEFNCSIPCEVGNKKPGVGNEEPSLTWDIFWALEHLDMLHNDDNQRIEEIKNKFFGDELDFCDALWKYFAKGSDDYFIIQEAIEDSLLVDGLDTEGIIECVDDLLARFEKDSNHDFIEAFCIAFLRNKCDKLDEIERNSHIGGNSNDAIFLNDWLKRLEEKRIMRKRKNK